jgi:hypothetical protein
MECTRSTEEYKGMLEFWIIVSHNTNARVISTTNIYIYHEVFRMECTRSTARVQMSLEFGSSSYTIQMLGDVYIYRAVFRMKCTRSTEEYKGMLEFWIIVSQNTKARVISTTNV